MSLRSKFFWVLVVVKKIKNHLKFPASHTNVLIHFCFKLKIFLYTPRPFACKGGGVGGGVIKFATLSPLPAQVVVARAEGGLRGRLCKKDGGIRFSFTTCACLKNSI